LDRLSSFRSRLPALPHNGSIPGMTKSSW
jgi:ribosomal protein S14